jgi:tripartite-type tricarboxylate transporter receptor subunit TctC
MTLPPPVLSRNETQTLPICRVGRVLVAFLAFLAFLLATVPVPAAQPVPSFRGKVIKIIVGASAGGGYDAYARLLAAHLGRNIPGTPSVIVQNMAGAGSLLASNYIANVAPKDGTVIGAVNPVIVTDSLFYPDRFRFDSRKVKWIGSALRETHVATAWHRAPVQTFDQVFQREFLVAGAGGSTTSYPAVLNGVLGTRFKVVAGYAGTAEGGLAMERGEVDGNGAITWASVKVTQAQALRDKQLRVLVQFGLAKHKELPDVPWIYDYVRNDADHAALDLVFGPQEFGRPYLVAEGVPDATVGILRTAFDRTMSSVEFRSDAARRGLDLDPTTGAEIQGVVEDIHRTPAAVIDRVRKLLEATAR